MATTKLFTVEDLWELGDDARFELVRGELREYVAAGEEHGDIAAELAWQLMNYARERMMRKVVLPETGFIMSRDPDSVLVPDLAFIHESRLPPDRDQRKFIPLPPDFAVEAVSPSNTRREITDKVEVYLAAGVSLVWVVDPGRQTVTVYSPGVPKRTLHPGDAVDGGDVLPGFRVAISEIVGL